MRKIYFIDDSSRDQNAKMRITARLGRYFPGSKIEGFGVNNSIEASLFLLDLMDALVNPLLPARSISSEKYSFGIIVNSAKRKGNNNHNVTFGKVVIDDVLIITTLGGYELSLLKKLQILPQDTWAYDIPKVLKWAVDSKLITSDYGVFLNETQFRTFELAPLLLLWESNSLSGLSDCCNQVKEIPDLNNRIVFSDIYGNLKTSEFSVYPIDYNRDFLLKIGDEERGVITSYNQLSEIPDGKLGLNVWGSSGFNNIRLIELNVKGGSAKDFLRIEGNPSFEYLFVDNKFKVGV